MRAGRAGGGLDTADPQARIINHHHGALLVLAPVGSGKTHALIERTASIIAAGVDPRRILCLTFTNRAAEEVRDRLAKRFPGEDPRVTVSTFHGLCASIVRREARAAGIPADFTICDDPDAVELMAEIMSSSDRDARPLQAEIGRLKSAVETKSFRWPPDYASIFAPLGGQRGAAIRYQDELRARHLLDFSDLVYCANAILVRSPEARERWSRRFDHVMVDEIQDTHRSEYRVVYILARRSGNLALFGDPNQTIYGWRGSDPNSIIAQMEQNFPDLERISLVENRRSTRHLVDVAEAFGRATFRPDGAPVIASADAEAGDAPVWHLARDEVDEGDWIADQIERLRQEPDFDYRRVGVLTANNYYGIGLSEVLTARKIPHVTVEQFDFFRRREVKDALAVLRLLLNPSDTAAVHRVTERLVSGVAQGTLVRIQKKGEAVGLARVDLLKAETHECGEPFAQLIDAHTAGSLVVLDVETTGLEHDAEVIEIAATRLEAGRPAQRFHRLLRNDRTVGDSLRTHGLTDEHLAQHGQPAHEALMAAFEFIGDDLVVGHNIGFDARIMGAHARRLGLEAPTIRTADTLELAQRFLDTGDFSLTGLASALGLPHIPAHRAEADVATTVDLLAALMPRVSSGAEARRRIVDEEGEPFAELADDLDRWRTLARASRPARVLSRVLDESGLREIHVESARREHLEALVQLFEMRDQADLDPWIALDRQVRVTAMTRYVDQLLDDDPRIPVLTIHQSKGLEFDTVFIAGLFEGELPRRRSLQENRLKEEQRLFYVALTRARKQLILSAPRSARGRVCEPSQFIHPIRPLLRVE